MNINDFHFRSKKYWFIPGLLILLILFRLCLPSLVKYYAHRQLNKDPAYQGSVEKVHLHLWRGAYSADGLKIVRVDGQKTFPFLAAEHIDVGVRWRDLLRLTVVAEMNIRNPEINIVQEKKIENGKVKEKVQIGQETTSKKKEELQTWQKVFKNLVPLNVSKLTVTGGTIHYRDLTSKPRVDIFLDQVNIDGSNLTNSTRVAENLFGTIKVEARAMHSGQLITDLYINPLKAPVEFKMNLRLADLNLVELNPFFKAYGKFDIKKGKFNLYSEIASADKKIEGYFKPLFKELQVADFKKDKEKGIIHAAWEQIVGTIGSLFKNHSKNQQAAKIPFSGRVDDPSVDTWTTVTSILKNVFIKPLQPRLENSVDLKDLKRKK